MDLNILVLAAEEHKDTKPIPCLQDYKNTTLLQYICKNTLPKNRCHYTFVFQKNAIIKYHLDNIAKILVPDAKILSLSGMTGGSACTALYAACVIDQSKPLLIVSTNEVVDINYNDVIITFLNSNADAAVMTFESIHPRYSYAKFTNGVITEFAQQNPISSTATTGSFLFRKTSDFVFAAKQSILKHTLNAQKFYIAPIFNQLILKNMTINHYDVNDRYIPFKTEDCW